jgi:hypothetical protein
MSVTDRLYIVMKNDEVSGVFEDWLAAELESERVSSKMTQIIEAGLLPEIYLKLFRLWKEKGELTRKDLLESGLHPF